MELSSVGKKAPKTLEDFLKTKYNEPKKWDRLKSDARQRRSDLKGANAPFTFNKAQFGKKAGKHASDFGLNPNSAGDREKLLEIINDIRNKREEVRRGPWRGQEQEVFFHIKGQNVVLTKPEGEYITILKGGTENERVKNARRIEV